MVMVLDLSLDILDYLMVIRLDYLMVIKVGLLVMSLKLSLDYLMVMSLS
jgi:hypothetical protein